MSHDPWDLEEGEEVELGEGGGVQAHIGRHLRHATSFCDVHKNHLPSNPQGRRWHVGKRKSSGFSPLLQGLLCLDLMECWRERRGPPMKHCCLLKPIARGDGGHSQVSEFMVQEMRVQTPNKTDDSELTKTAVHKCGFLMLRAPKCLPLYKSAQFYFTNTTKTPWCTTITLIQ